MSEKYLRVRRQRTAASSTHTTSQASSVERVPRGDRLRATWESLTPVLGILIVLFGVLTAAATAITVYYTYSPVLQLDQWDLVNYLSGHDGRLSISQLWAQHNEHRIPWGKLAGYADLKFFGGRNVSLLLEVYLLRSLECLFLIWMFRRHSDLSRPQILTACGFIAYCIFYPIQMENYYWGFQVAFVCLPLAVSASIGAAVLHGDSMAKRTSKTWCSWSLVVSLAAGIVAETSIASGIFVWPILILVSIIYRMSWKTKALIGCVSVSATSAYLWAYRSPTYHADPVSSLQRPVAVAKYVAAYLAFSWDPSPPTASPWPTFVQLVSLCAVGAVIWGLARVVILGKKPCILEVLLLAYAVFLLLTAVVTALGRINFGVAQAASSRYQSFALDFWACMAGILLLWRSGNEATPPRLIEIQALMLILMLASVPRFISTAADAKARQYLLEAGWEEISQDPKTAAGVLYPRPVPEAFAYLRSRHLGPAPALPLGSTRVVNEDLHPRVNGFLMLPPSACAGFLDLVGRVPGKAGIVAASGWAWNLKSGTRPKRVLLADANGVVIDSAAVDRSRPDVPKAVPNIQDSNTGWMIATSARPGSTIRAFAISDDSTAVCPLGNEFNFR